MERPDGLTTDRLKGPRFQREMMEALLDETVLRGNRQS